MGVIDNELTKPPIPQPPFPLSVARAPERNTIVSLMGPNGNGKVSEKTNFPVAHFSARHFARVKS